MKTMIDPLPHHPHPLYPRSAEWKDLCTIERFLQFSQGFHWSRWDKPEKKSDNSGAPAREALQRRTILRNPCIPFLMIILAGGIARGLVRTTPAATTATTVESPKMAAILQITGWQRDMQPWFTVYFFGIGHPCYDQLTPVKSRYPQGIMWPYRGLKLTAYRGQVFFEVDRWPGAGFSIGSWAHIWVTC